MRTLSELLDTPVVVYGAGGVGTDFVNNVCVRHQLTNVIVLDRRFERGTFHGYPAIHPGLYRPRANDLGIVALRRKDCKQDAERYFRDIGITKVANAFEWYETIAGDMILNDTAIDDVAASDARMLFGDVPSLAVFDAVLGSHRTKTAIPVPTSPEEEQYFPQDIPAQFNYDYSIQLGAYTGEDFEHFPVKPKLLVCFEPDSGNYQRVVDRTRKTPFADKVVCLPVAACGYTKAVRFCNNLGLGSHVNTDGSAVIQAVALDDLVAGNSGPTFIAADIEGCELDALQGATQTLRRHKPNLAICVYHRVRDLWEIPLWLDSLKLGYRFWLRNYTGGTHETVLYAAAIPQNDQHADY